MAKSDSNSNDLRQDQPECSPCEGRVGGKSRAKRDFTIAWSKFGDTNRVTPNYRGSHQIPSCGGPQGRNPHLLRISTYFERVLNPFEARRWKRIVVELNHRDSQRVFALRSECPDTDKGVGTSSDTPQKGVPCRPGHPGATFAFLRMAGEHKRPSNRRRFVMRFHASR